MGRTLHGNKKRATTRKPQAVRRPKPKARVPSKNLPSWVAEGARHGVGLLSLVVSVYLLSALVTYDPMDPGFSYATTYGQVIHNAGGRIGAWFADWVLVMAGFAAYGLPVGLFMLGWTTVASEIRKTAIALDILALRMVLIGAMTAVSAILLHMHAGAVSIWLPQGVTSGGMLGQYLSFILLPLIGWSGASLACGLLLVLFCCAIVGVSPMTLLDVVGSAVFMVLSTMVNGVKAFIIWLGKHRPLEMADDLIQRHRDEVAQVGGVPTLNEARGAAEPKTPKITAFLGRLGLRSEDKPTQEDELPPNDPQFDDSDSLPSFETRNNIDFDAPFFASNQSEDDLLTRMHAGESAESNNDVLLNVKDEDPAVVPFSMRDDRPITPQQSMEVAAAKTGTEAKPQIPSAMVKPAQPSSVAKSTAQPTPASRSRKPIHSQGPLPSVELLDPPTEKKQNYSQKQLDQLSRLIEHRFKDFNVIVEVVAVSPGPVIVRFELQPAPGVKSAQIANLSKDIARSLGVMAVRVVEVIPGRTTVGVEIPNENREMVELSEIIMSDEFRDGQSPLTLALGKDISGKPVVANLAKMPHLLVAGTTGSGKSVGVNAMLISLLYKATAEQVRLILIDPKMLELSVYEGIPHLLTPVVTDMNDAANSLRWAVGEMERRYQLMAALGVRNLVGFNRKLDEAVVAGARLVDPLYDPAKSADPSGPPPALEKLPHIVIVIDEFADMMMVVGKKCEELIARIAQKARAAGIHLILATQRPSVDVITGLIKANIPTRMAFQVSSKIDSRTILDQMGAENLLGHGDMLYLPPGTANPDRVHGAFVDDHEVHAVVDFLKEGTEPQYLPEIVNETLSIPGLSGESGADPSETDALYDQAVAIVTESRKASISYVQRRLKIGYNRAARMIEDMEAAGVISGVTGSGQREVLAPAPV